ncbi:MAG: hypothetical protein HOY78_34465 [Saccharothrix sp.]|nr:hypothetical protein [Saccharothrix sp.]
MKFRRYGNDLPDNELVGSDVQDYGGVVRVDATLRAGDSGGPPRRGPAITTGWPSRRRRPPSSGSPGV